MARITRKNDDLLNEYKLYKKKFALCIIALFITLFSSSILGPIAFIGFIICGILFSKIGNKMLILKSGVEGEELTAEIISSLPDSFYAFQNVKVTYEDKTSELDMVVVGPTGVFVIETKNMTGTILANYDNEQWVQKKKGENGRTTSKTFYSPVKQVGTHVYRLAHYLRDNGCSVHVDSVVFFANPDANVQLLGTPTQTLVLSMNVLGGSVLYTCLAEKEQVLSDEIINQICELLDK